MTILQLRTFRTQITTNARALVLHRLHGYVAKRISHTAFNISCLSKIEFESYEEQIFSRSQPAVNHK